jgi:hypothetical protein
MDESCNKAVDNNKLQSPLTRNPFLKSEVKIIKLRMKMGQNVSLFVTTA